MSQPPDFAPNADGNTTSVEPGAAGSESAMLAGEDTSHYGQPVIDVNAPAQFAGTSPAMPAPLPHSTWPAYTPAPVAPAAAPRRLGTVIIAALVAGLIGGGIGAQVFGRTGELSPGTVLNNTGGDSSARPATTIAGIAQRTLPCVVSVETTSANGSGNGSGEVIASRAGSSYILTNNHVVLDVIESGGRIDIQLQNGDRYPATVVGRDPSYDLAVLRVAKSGLPVIPMGDSSKVVVGDSVIAIGSPLGLSGTVTSGIVSALRRPVTTNPSNTRDETSFISAIQTDAAINPGNSGGPLMDANGRMIGVNSAIATLGSEMSGQAGNIGVGFAIPINQARRVAEQIINTGRSTYPVIGVQLDRNYSGDGARVDVVEPTGPSAAALRPGDVITRIGDRAMADAVDVITTIRSYSPGQQIKVTVRRGAVTRNYTITLGSRQSM